MSDYEPGQRVRLKSWDELKEICEECESGDLYNHEEDQYSHFWNKNLHGKEYEIEEIDGKVVLLEGEGWVYSWEIEPIEEKPKKSDHIPAAKKKVQKRTWKITTEARSSDGIVVSKDRIEATFGEARTYYFTTHEARDLMNKLRKGLEKHTKLFNS